MVNVSFVSVRYTDGRPEELAYRDGAFVAPFLASTRTGDTFRLARAGGWPSDPTVVIGEAAAASASTWKQLYRVDFRTLGASSPQTFSTTGAVTIDGLTWYRKAGVAGYSTNGALDASGLRANSGGSSEGNAAFIGPRLILPMASIAGWSASLPTVFYARCTSTYGSMSCLIGHGDYAASAAVPTTQEQEKALRMYCEGAPQNPQIFADGYVLLNASSMAAPLFSMSLSSVGFVLRPHDAYSYHHAMFDWQGSTPDPTTVSAGTVNTYQPIRCTDGRAYYIRAQSTDGVTKLQRTMANLCFVTGVHGSGAQLASLQELVVWQPGAA